MVDFLISMMAYILGYAINWIVICGVIKLITICFGWTFTWPIATGIWLILILLESIFRK